MTVGELRRALQDVPDDYEVYCYDWYTWSPSNTDVDKTEGCFELS